MFVCSFVLDTSFVSACYVVVFLVFVVLCLFFASYLFIFWPFLFSHVFVFCLLFPTFQNMFIIFYLLLSFVRFVLLNATLRCSRSFAAAVVVSPRFQEAKKTNIFSCSSYFLLFCFICSCFSYLLLVYMILL